MKSGMKPRWLLSLPGGFFEQPALMRSDSDPEVVFTVLALDKHCSPGKSAPTHPIPSTRNLQHQQ